jgi:serine O-acetyltransferase
MIPMEQQIEGIVDSILEDYRNGRDIDRLDYSCHPDKEVIIDMIGKLLRIVYPGATREKSYRIYNARHNLSMLIEDVMYNLNKQLSLIYMGTMERQEAKAKAQELSLEFFRQIPAVRAMLENEGFEAPKFTVDPTVTDFYAFTKDSFKMENYKFHAFNFEIPMAI